MKLPKRMTKFIACVAIAMVSVTSTFANDLPVLTLEQAISGAISADAGQQEVYRTSKAADTQAIIDSSEYGSNAYQNSYYGKLQTEREEKYHKDAVVYNATKLYNSIALQEKQVAFYDKKLALQEKQYSQAELKYNNGVLSKIEYETAQSSIKEQRTAKDKMQAQLDKTREDFKNLTHYDTIKYSLEDHSEVEFYEPVANIHYFFDSSVDEMLEYQKILSEKYSEYYLSDLFRMGDHTAVSYYNGMATEAQKKQAIQDAKDSRTSTLNGLYSTLKTTEQSIKELRVTIEDQEKTLAAQKLKLEKGLVSQIEVEQAELNLEEQKLKLVELQVNYNATKDAVKKPWVNFY